MSNRVHENGSSASGNTRSTPSPRSDTNVGDAGVDVAGHGEVYEHEGAPEARGHGGALRFGAFELLDGQLQAFLDIPDYLGLEQVALGAQQRGLGQRKVECAQHVEAFMGFAQVGMGFLDDHAGFRKALRGLAGDGYDFGIDRRDAEIGRIGDAFRLAGHVTQPRCDSASGA